jgi:hypothetical protein
VIHIGKGVIYGLNQVGRQEGVDFAEGQTDHGAAQGLPTGDPGRNRDDPVFQPLQVDQFIDGLFGQHFEDVITVVVAYLPDPFADGLFVHFLLQRTSFELLYILNAVKQIEDTSDVVEGSHIGQEDIDRGVSGDGSQDQPLDVLLSGSEMLGRIDLDLESALGFGLQGFLEFQAGKMEMGTRGIL